MSDWSIRWQIVRAVYGRSVYGIVAGVIAMVGFFDTVLPRLSPGSGQWWTLNSVLPHLTWQTWLALLCAVLTVLAIEGAFRVVRPRFASSIRAFVRMTGHGMKVVDREKGCRRFSSALEIINREGTALILRPEFVFEHETGDTGPYQMSLKDEPGRTIRVEPKASREITVLADELFSSVPPEWTERFNYQVPANARHCLILKDELTGRSIRVYANHTAYDVN